jgi:hypothetical protein
MLPLALAQTVSGIHGGVELLNLIGIGAQGSSMFGEGVALENSQVNYAGHPTVLPPPALLLAAQLSGFFQFNADGTPWEKGREILTYAMRGHGIPYGTKGFMGLKYGGYEKRIDAWDAVIHSMQVRPAIADAFKGWIAGVLDDEKFKTMMMRNGANHDDWRWLKPFMSQRLTVDDAVAAWRRGMFSDDAIDKYLKQLQVGMKEDRIDILQLSAIIPGPQDIIRYAVREAFNPKQIAALGLDLELDQNPDYLAWAHASGLGNVQITTPDGMPKSVNFAELEWYSHWVLPSPGQAYDFHHKFYAASRYGPSPYMQYGPEFNIDTLRNLLKANDYSPKWRDNLAGASFVPYTRIDVRRIRKAGIITKEAVYHNYRASGYDDEHASALTDWVEKDIKDHETAGTKSGAKTELCKAYQLGLLDQKGLKDGLEAVGFTLMESGSESALCDMRWGTKYASEAVTTVKRGYLTGAFTDFEAAKILGQYDITQERIDQYIHLWQLKLQGTRKQVSTQMVSNWFIDGIIGLPEFLSRLSKLGYSPEDLTRIVQAAQWEQSKRLARAQKIASQEAQRLIEKNLRDSEKARKQASQIARQSTRDAQTAYDKAAKEESNRIKRLLAGRSEANLRTWLADKLITEDEVRGTFNQRGWASLDIDRWLAAERARG